MRALRRRHVKADTETGRVNIDGYVLYYWYYYDTKARCRLEIPIRHIGQNSTRIEHELQLNMWPHGMKTVSRAATMQILHICCSRTCSSTCRRTYAAAEHLTG